MRTRLNEILASDDLPSLPEVAVRVLEIARQDEPDFAELASVVRLDPAIASRLLKTANSPLFGLRTQASSVETVIPVLGVTLVRTLVLGFSLGDRILFSNRKLMNQARTIWRSSIIQATTAEMLAQRIPDTDPPTWFLAGMLQNIGKLAMLNSLRSQYVDVVSASEDRTAELAREQRAFGFTHAEVGAALCERWNLDDSLVATFGTRHQSDRASCETDSQLSAAVAIGRMTAEYFIDVVRDLKRDRASIDDALIRCMAVPPDELVRFYAEIDRRAGEVAAFMGIDIGQDPVLEDLLADAHATLAKIAIQNQVDSLVEHRRQSRTGFFRKSSKLADAAALQSTCDEETGVYSQGVLEDSIDLHLKQSREKQERLGFLMLDLDQLSAHADRHGEEAASRLIRETADALVTTVRTTDVVIRSGDDEFIAILPGADRTMLKYIAERIRFRVAVLRPAPSGANPDVSCSIGAVCHVPGGRRFPQRKQILRELESAVFQSKKRGGNFVSVVNLSGTASQMEDSDRALVARL